MGLGGKHSLSLYPVLRFDTCNNTNTLVMISQVSPPPPVRVRTSRDCDTHAKTCTFSAELYLNKYHTYNHGAMVRA